jgi:hypothetical protein
MNFSSLTGRFASGKIRRALGFESSLERDLELLLEFDPRVLEFEEQPVHVSWCGPGGKPHVYTPDFLVTYTHFDPARDPRLKCLVEVKYRFDLVKNLAQYRPAFKAAISYAADRGWRFKILTEFEIRAPFLRPVRFLLPFLREEPDEAMEALVLATVARQAERPRIKPKINTVLDELCPSADRGEVLRSLWRLVAVGRLRINFRQSFTLSSIIWIPSPSETRPLLLPLGLPGLYRG